MPDPPLGNLVRSTSYSSVVPTIVYSSTYGLIVEYDDFFSITSFLYSGMSDLEVAPGTELRQDDIEKFNSLVIYDSFTTIGFQLAIDYFDLVHSEGDLKLAERLSQRNVAVGLRFYNDAERLRYGYQMYFIKYRGESFVRLSRYRDKFAYDIQKGCTYLYSPNSGEVEWLTVGM